MSLSPAARRRKEGVRDFKQSDWQNSRLKLLLGFCFSTVQNVSLLLSNYSLGRIQAGHWDLGQITAGMRCSASCPELQPCYQKEPLLLTLRNIWVSFSADPTEKVLSHLMVLKLMVCLEKIEQKIPSLTRFAEKFLLATLENSLVLSPVDCFYYLRASGTFCGKLVTFSDKIFFQTRCVQIWSVWRLCAALEMFIY